MKQKCVICTTASAKRACLLKNRAMICPSCCAISRSEACRECTYYTEAQKYQSEKSENLKNPKFIIEIHPDIDETLDKGLALVEEGAIADGEKLIMRCAETHPDYHVVLYARGVVHAYRDELDEAISFFKKAVGIFPCFAEAIFNLGLAYQKKRAIAEAIESFQLVLRYLAPDDSMAIKARSIIDGFASIIRKTHGISLNDYLKAINKFNEGVALMAQQHWRKAIVAYKDSLALCPDSYQAYGNLGICHASLGQKAQALEAFDKALAIDPEYELAMVNRSIVEALKEGETLVKSSVETINYNEEYRQQGKSYIKSLFNR